MTTQQIISDLRSRGEHSINFNEYPETGVIKTKHGKYTFNYWIVKNGELVCVDCKTRYN